MARRSIPRTITWWRTPGASRRGWRGMMRQDCINRVNMQRPPLRLARAAPGPVGALSIAMIKATFRALLVALARSPETPEASSVSTRRAAVGVAPTTGATEAEQLAAPPASPQPEDLHGPMGPEMAGRRWTRPRECATTWASRLRLPWGGCARGPGGCVSGPSPSHLRGRGTLPENWLACHSWFGLESRLIRNEVSDYTRGRAQRPADASKVVTPPPATGTIRLRPSK